jgi:hypothetical protein
MPPLRDVTGQRFGYLTAVRLMPERRLGKAVWECQCDCGCITYVEGAHLWSGNTTSCGCRRVEICVDRNTTHGLSDHPLYFIWFQMIDRCENPDNKSYKNYGGRGVSVCERWRRSFEDFVADMGPCPPGLTLERKNNNGNYEKDNCCWDTRRQQAINKRKSPTWGIRETPSGKYIVEVKPIGYLGTFKTQAEALAVRNQADFLRRRRATK